MEMILCRSYQGSHLDFNIGVLVVVNPFYVYQHLDVAKRRRSAAGIHIVVHHVVLVAGEVTSRTKDNRLSLFHYKLRADGLTQEQPRLGRDCSTLMVVPHRVNIRLYAFRHLLHPVEASADEPGRTCPVMRENVSRVIASATLKREPSE